MPRPASPLTCLPRPASSSVARPARFHDGVSHRKRISTLIFKVAIGSILSSTVHPVFISEYLQSSFLLSARDFFIRSLRFCSTTFSLSAPHFDRQCVVDRAKEENLKIHRVTPSEHTRSHPVPVLCFSQGGTGFILRSTNFSSPSTSPLPYYLSFLPTTFFYDLRSQLPTT